MATTPRLFFAFLFLCIFRQGWADECSLSNIYISLGKTGHFIGDKPEFEVRINNDCKCSQSNVIVKCKGFSSAEEVDPTKFKLISGQNYLVNDGKPIQQDSPVIFTYASYYTYDFRAVSSKIDCN